jgi:Arc/MetJ-type ribon-helix-helix transcriptional regulator
MVNMENMPKQKVTVTIEKRLLEWVDREIQSLRFHNRSHAFEYALAKLMEAEKEPKRR